MSGQSARASRTWIWLVAIPVMALLSACGGTGASRTAEAPATGTVNIQITWPTSTASSGGQLLKGLSLNASGAPTGITDIRVTLTVGQYQASQTQSAAFWAAGESLTAPVGTGTLQIDALNSSGSVLFTGQTTVTVAPNVTTQVVVLVGPTPLLNTPVSIQVTPVNASIAAGTTQQYAALGTYLDGSQKDVTGSVTWASDATGVATIDGSGLATGVSVGSANITASLAGVSSTVTLNVTAAFLESIQVTPAAASIPAGGTQQYVAIGTFSDKSTQDLTNGVTWTSGTPGFATISASGLATGVALGTSNITASYQGVTSNTAVLTVTDAVLLTITVDPASASIPAGTTQQFKATGNYTNGPRDVSAVALWSSDNAAAATVSATGLASGIAAGTANITASVGTVASNAAVLTVARAKLLSIMVTPATASIANGSTQQYKAVGNYTNGQADITKSVNWSWTTPDTGAVTIGLDGLATGVSEGTVYITATSSDGPVTSNKAFLTVTGATLVSIQVTPPTANIPDGTTQQYKAIGTYTDKGTQDITGKVSWNSGDTTVATIGMSGLATGVGLGSAKIQASLNGVQSQPVNLAVSAATLVSIQVTPGTANVAAGQTVQYTATGIYTDRTTKDLTVDAAWSSETPGVATITGKGLATGVASGSSNIRATFGTVISDPAVLNVKPVTLVSIAVTPGMASIAEGTTQQFTAIGTYSDGSTPDITRSVAWVSSNYEVATVGASGLATGVDEGNATITASLGGVTSGAANLTVSPATLLSITVTPAAASVAAGTTQKFVATGTFSDGSKPDISKQVAWSSSDTSVATVGTSGTATGVAAGTVTVTATLGSVTSNTATLTVTAAMLVSIQVTPATASIASCATQQFTATGTYSDGSTQTLTSVASWISSATSVATIGFTGVARGVSAGTANITATYGGMTSVPAALTVTSASICDKDSVGDEHSGGNGDDRDGHRDGDDHDRRGDNRHRFH